MHVLCVRATISTTASKSLTTCPGEKDTTFALESLPSFGGEHPE
jgi:hypothetical protein